MFGRKKRPSHVEGRHAPAGLAQLNAAAGDDDDEIIDLVDIIEIPEDLEAEEELLGLSDVAMDSDYPTEAPPGEMDDGAMAAILEDNEAEILEDESEPADDIFLSSQQVEVTGLNHEPEGARFHRNFFDEEEVLGSDELETEETLLAEADSDQLISELMASQNDQETEDGAVLVGEYEEAIEQPLPAKQDRDVFTDWDTAEVLTDLGVEQERAVSESEGGVRQFLGEIPGKDFVTDDDIFETAVAEDAEVSIAQEQLLLEEESSVAVYQKEPEAGLSEMAAVSSYESSSPLEAQDVTDEAPDSTGVTEEPLAEPMSGISPVTESLFSIIAASPVLSDSLALEEEILFAIRAEEEAPEVSSQSDTRSDLLVEESVSQEERLPAEDAMNEEVFRLETFLPIAAPVQSVYTGDLDLLDLVEHLESRLLVSLPGVVGPELHEELGSLVKEELEDLRRLIDQIDATDELRL